MSELNCAMYYQQLFTLCQQAVYLSVEGSTESFYLENVLEKPSSSPLMNVVSVLSSDEEGWWCLSKKFTPALLSSDLTQFLSPVV